MQIFLTFRLRRSPSAPSSGLPAPSYLREKLNFRTKISGSSPLFELVLHLAFYAFVVTWLTVVVTSVLGCLFIRFTAGSPGCIPRAGSRGLSSCTE